MENQFSLFDVLILIGITQGIITSVLLLVSKRNSRSNLFLALALIAFCFLSTKILLHTLQLWDTLIFRYFPNGVEVVLAPLLYFYVISLIDSKFKFQKKHLLHFIPFLLSQSYAFIVYFAVFNIHELEAKDSIASLLRFDEVKKIEDYLSLISLIIYLTFGFIKLKTFRKLLRDTTSDNTFPDFNWLKNMFILFSLLGLFLLTNLALNTISLDIDRFLRWEVYYIFIAFIIYYLGFVGYKQPDYQKVHIEEPVNPLKISKLSNEKNEEIVKIIEKALQKDKVFLNPTISSQELAKLLELSQSNLSYVVNNSFKKSFRDLINEYRVEEVKSKLNNIDYKHMSILGIALECGFNSEASFYRIFKKNTGVSPKEYIHQKKTA